MNRPTFDAIQLPAARALASIMLASIMVTSCGRASAPAGEPAGTAPPAVPIINHGEGHTPGRARQVPDGAGLTCTRQPPRVRLSPPTTAAQPAGTPVPFALVITNRDSASCPPGEFEFLGGLPFGLTGDSLGLISIAPGETVHTTVNVVSLIGGPTGPLSFQYFVFERAGWGPEGFEQATYVVAPPDNPRRDQPPSS